MKQNHIVAFLAVLIAGWFIYQKFFNPNPSSADAHSAKPVLQGHDALTYNSNQSPSSALLEIQSLDSDFEE